MTGRRIVVCSTKYDGSPHWEFDSWLVHEEGSLVVTHNFAGQELQTSDGPWTTPYDTRNHFWAGRWYNVMRLELPDGGGLHGWYCNVTTPAMYDGESVRYADLDLDLFVPADGEPEVLDEDEFAENSARMGYPAGVIEEARRALDELLALVAGGAFPFNGR
jgi:protein associated with RNAse G/E